VCAHARRPFQGYNVQAAVNEHHIVLAAEITVETGDFSHLEPMVTATIRPDGGMARACVEDMARA
jgi:hypothetical protein